MLTISVLLLPWLLSSPLVSSSPLAKVRSVCDRTFCGAGRECVSTDRGEPVCRCLQQCDVAENWVCGSNGRTYRNHCELHRDACTTQNKIHVQHRARCLEKPTETDVSPMACFLSHRDWLRESAMRWIQEEARSGDEASNVTTADALLQTYFKTYDDGDSELDSKEFLSFLKHNETTLNLTYSSTLETNTLLRSLCVDALIELSDENADWKLSLTEFINCLTPTYHPYERSDQASPGFKLHYRHFKPDLCCVSLITTLCLSDLRAECALEDEVFEDGAETRMECNKCVCACGNWVCTALTCNGEHRVEEDVREGAEEEMTEEEWSSRVAELNTLQDDSAKSNSP